MSRRRRWLDTMDLLDATIVNVRTESDSHGRRPDPRHGRLRGACHTTGRHLLHIGITLIAVGAATLALMLTGVDSASTWDLVPGLLLVGAGVGTVLGQIIQFILAAVSMNEVGSASGVMEASQQLSTSLGVAVLGTIFFALFEHHPATEALRVTSWLCLVPLAAAFACVFLPPKYAQADGAH